jgi:hypothetical protein
MRSTTILRTQQDRAKNEIDTCTILEKKNGHLYLQKHYGVRQVTGQVWGEEAALVGRNTWFAVGIAARPRFGVVDNELVYPADALVLVLAPVFD